MLCAAGPSKKDRKGEGTELLGVLARYETVRSRNKIEFGLDIDGAMGSVMGFTFVAVSKSAAPAQHLLCLRPKLPKIYAGVCDVKHVVPKLCVRFLRFSSQNRIWLQNGYAVGLSQTPGNYGTFSHYGTGLIQEISMGVTCVRRLK